MKNDKHHIPTRIVHAGRDPEQQQGFVNPPVYHGSTVIYPTLERLDQAKTSRGERNEIVYGRFGSPTTMALENAMAELENGYGGVAVSSGLAAVTTALLAYVSAGDHALIVDTVYGPTRMFCDEFLNRMGVEISYYDPMIGAGIDACIQDNTRCIFLESPGSLTFEVQDVPAITRVAASRGVVTMIDNSWASPCYYRPLEHGVNVSIIAATKYIVGHADALLGLIVSDQENDHRVRMCRNLLGQHVGPDDIYLGLRGLRTLSVRMAQHYQQGLALAGWLQQHPEIIRVIHPALPDCPGHEFWKRDFSGASGLFSVELKKRSRRALAAFVEELELFSMGASWGGFESLILPVEPAHSRTATHWNSTNPLLRIHAGLEQIDDLIKDLEAGLERYSQYHD